MAELEVLGYLLSVPDCTSGGDHGSLLKSVSDKLANNLRSIYSDTPCVACGLLVVARRDFDTAALSAAVEPKRQGSWAGM